MMVMWRLLSFRDVLYIDDFDDFDDFEFDDDARRKKTRKIEHRRDSLSSFQFTRPDACARSRVCIRERGEGGRDASFVREVTYKK